MLIIVLIPILTYLVILGIKFLNGHYTYRETPPNKKAHLLFNWIENYFWGLGLVTLVIHMQQADYQYLSFILASFLFYIPLFFTQFMSRKEIQKDKWLLDIVVRIIFLIIFAHLFWFFEITHIPFEWLYNLIF